MIDCLKFDWNELKNYSIFPLVDKRPMAGFSWKKYQAQRATEEEINSWVENKIFNNFAIVTGDYNHILVVDLDVKEGGSYDKSIEDKLPNTLIKKSLNGGFHFYYKYPSYLSINVKNNFRYKVDIRASGSYVAYYQNNTTNPKFSNEIAEAPQWLLNELTTKNNITDSKIEPKIIETTNLINIGERNTVMTSKIGEMLVKTTPDLWDNLWDIVVGYNNTFCNPPIEENSLRNSFDCLCRAEREKIKNHFDIMTTNQVLEKEESEHPFLIDGLIVEGSVNSLTSDSGKGKSLVMLKMAEAIAKGEPFLGKLNTIKAKTLIFDLEMSENDLIQRTHSIIQNSVDGLDFARCDDFDIERDFESLKKIIIDGNYKFIIFDTFSFIHSRQENDNSDMAFITKKLIAITKLRATVLFLHHHRKAYTNERASQSSSRGATEIVSKVASHLLLDSKEKTVIFNEKEYSGLNLSMNQMKKRQKKRAIPFTMDCFYDEITKKTTFIYIDGDVNASATEKAKKYILSKMEKGKEYIVNDFETNGIGKNSIGEALKELTTQIKIRKAKKNDYLPNGTKTSANRKFYSLK